MLTASKIITRCAVAEWLERLGYGAKVAVRCEFEAGLRHATSGKLSLSTRSKWVPFSN